MKRRYALKQLMLATGIIGLVPSCLSSFERSSVDLKNLDISKDDEALLAEIAETILPKTDTLGAKDLGIHVFILKMLDDCYDPDVQKSFVKSLKGFNAFTKDKFGETFITCTNDVKKANLLSLSKDDMGNSNMADFYKIVKQRTIQGYLNSEYVMSNLIKYEMVPGRYNGYFPVATS